MKKLKKFNAVGRPKSDPTDRITLRVNKDNLDLLRLMCEKSGKSVNSVLSKIIADLVV